MERRPYKQVLYNLPIAADVDTSTDPSKILLRGLLPIEVKDYLNTEEVAFTAEVSQVVTIAGGTTLPTIVASRKYQVLIGHPTDRNPNENLQGYKPYGTTAPAILSGTAGTDRHNVFVSLAYRINNDPSSKVTAYPVITVAQTNSVAFAVGEIVTETATGATGVNLSGTTGTLTIGVISGTFSGAVAGTLTGSIAGASTSTTHVVTNGLGLRIVDDAGYYDAKGLRHGPSAIMIGAGFSSTLDFAITVAGVIGFGSGADLLTRVPVYETTTGNIKWGGEYGFPSNEAPVAASSYSMFIVRSRVYMNDDSQLDRSSPATIEQLIYADKDAAGFAAWKTALLAL